MKLCSVEGCGRRHEARGWCDAHYCRWKRGGSVREEEAVGIFGRFGTQHVTTPHAKVRPTTKDIAWTAGFLEGEGSFLFNSRSERVCCPQKDPECLERLQLMFGGTISRPKSERVNRWAVCGSRARGLMLTLYTSMSQRRRQQISKALGHA